MSISELPSLWQTRSSNSFPSRLSSASFKVVKPSEVWFLWFITTNVVSVLNIFMLVTLRNRLRQYSRIVNYLGLCYAEAIAGGSRGEKAFYD